MCPFNIMCELVFVTTELSVVARTFWVTFQLISLRRLNFIQKIISVLPAFWLIFSSMNSSNCSVFLWNILLTLNLQFRFSPLLISDSVLFSLTMVSISLNLLFRWSKFLFFVSLMLVVTLTALAEIFCEKTILAHQSLFSCWPFWDKVRKVSKTRYCVSIVSGDWESFCSISCGNMRWLNLHDVCYNLTLT